MPRFSSSLALALSFLTACAAEEPCPGGGREVVLASAGACAYPSAIVVEGGFTCPASLPVRFDFETTTVCGPAGFDHREIEDDECVRGAIDCAPRVEGCEGARPDIESCERGAAWADCGGLGEPRFACIPDGIGCFWFLGGCVAEGYQASRCEAEDVCCIDDYPYGSSWREPGYPDASTYLVLHGWGTEPWDATRDASLDVEIAPLPSAERSVACTGAVPAPGPCDFRTSYGDARDTGALVVTLDSWAAAIGGWRLVVEVMRGIDEETWAGRACRVPFTDVASYACTSVPGPECATSGTVRIVDAPGSGAVDFATLRLELSATFADGTGIDVVL